MPAYIFLQRIINYLLFPDEHCCKIQNTGRHPFLSKSSIATVICWYQLILWQTQRSPPFAQPHHKKDDDSALKSSALSTVQDTTDNMWLGQWFAITSKNTLAKYCSGARNMISVQSAGMCVSASFCWRWSDTAMTLSNERQPRVFVRRARLTQTERGRHGVEQTIQVKITC